MVERLVDWPARLNAFLAERRTWSFVYGLNDCCMFAADAVQAITSVDPARALRGRYKSKRGAGGHIARAGGFDALVATVASRAGYSSVPVHFAQRGDVAVGILDGLPCLLVRTATDWVGPGPTGLAVVRSVPITTVYRVG